MSTKSIGFILRNINTEQFATIEKEIGSDSETELEINLGIRFGIDVENKLLACYLTIQYNFGKDAIVVLKLETEFEIKPESWDKSINKNADKIKFPKGFLRHLGVITVGTARGVIHAKTENTPYNKFYLPTIDLTEIVKKDEEFKLEI